MENRVEKLRKERGLNQEDFAKAIRVSRQTVSSIENGKYNPSLELAFTIADFLGKTIEEIFIYKRADEYDKKTCPTDYLILVNPFHKIPEDYFSGLELVEVRGYDGEVFLVGSSGRSRKNSLKSMGKTTRNVLSQRRDTASITQGSRWTSSLKSGTNG